MFDPHRPSGPIPADTPEVLADRAAVCRLAQVYALGIDGRDEAMVRSVFVPDAPIRGMLGEEPAATYVAKLLAGVGAYDATMHNITNQYAELAGDDALVWSYAVALHLEAPASGRADMAMGVQYRDRCTRTAAGWLIAARQTVKLWSRGPFPR